MASDTTALDPPPSKSKKNKKKKSKGASSKPNGEALKSNGVEHHEVEPDREEEGSEDEAAAAVVEEDAREEATVPTREPEPEETPDLPTNISNGSKEVDDEIDQQEVSKSPSGLSPDAEQRLDAAAKARDQLRAEVIELRKSLESIQQKHEDELASLNSQLEETQTGKEHAEGRYQKLLGQVNTIKKQLGERLKADAEELSQARTQIDELEEQNRSVKQDNEELQSQVSKLHSSKQQHEQETSSLRERANLAQQNWAKERDDLLSREAQLREEFEAARQAMQDWEVLAMEERSVREGLSDRLADLEDQLSNQREAYDRAASDRDTQSTTVDGLQRALQEIQEARKQELREVVENSAVSLEELRKQLKIAEESASASQASLETAQQDLERALPFEKEVKEKNLLIGKLRHEAVILNDHLTKALRFLKKGKPEDNVDRQLVTNHFLHFLTLDRSDPKKFQVLQLISALLGWDEEQNESAGLARPGASSQPINPAQSSTLRVPFSPFRRVSSSTSLASPRSPSASMNLNSIFTSPSPGSLDHGNNGDSPMSGNRSDSLAELWSGFLEREAQEGGASHSRRTSVSTSAGGTIGRGAKGRERSIREDGGEG